MIGWFSLYSSCNTACNRQPKETESYSFSWQRTIGNESCLWSTQRVVQWVRSMDDNFDGLGGSLLAAQDALESVLQKADAAALRQL